MTIARIQAISDQDALIEKIAKMVDGYAEARLKDMDDPGVDRDYVQGERHGAMDLATAIRALKRSTEKGGA